MNTSDLEELSKFVTQARELREIVREIMPYIEIIKREMPNDRLIRAGEAAQILGVSKSTIGQFVKAKLLTPFYTANSQHQKFWLSQVKALPRKNQWTLKEKF